ncbi:precorrin-6A synthase (deacetylating) [Nocardia seriolae]|uniref:precorrin-6A synthase (deacetylating) n=1 Tax=Nocardia seriolae TaxID=37332 RepID=UPI0003F429E4|nr:precorrin-6A synthase (deacetylating) [Nocardia seriolae]OJF78200.1 precorrin-6A synthase (deacetylating) [Nocardia seriolae]PSK32741.1 precorrin-6A synthase (deacetylating) [Nocardia seriolae]QOW31581.1 precorrin-6A synthase (deacetylating) [Nocardia seriolae]QUN19193.1 precorrin-6A synthase (deacetylating) [Nocardia seriolae]WNJ58624.1 precorrin-6A synthase (deacetylating) [Nocardia seriolae]
MRKLFVIGIGAGDPDQVTVQAVKAMRQVDVFFVIGKGADKQELMDVRATILAEHATQPHTIVEILDPPRDRSVPGSGADAAYQGAVADWHEARAELLERAFTETDGVGGILVWGDPALYDSTLRIVERVLERDRISFDCEVIPGITSVQALAAAHRIVLHEIGEPVHITTGRKLREEGLADGQSTLVMLDGDCSFSQVPGDDIHIWWGAYLGMPDEVIVEGPLRVVEGRIQRRRAALREAKGWIMDIYLLRRGL